MQNLLTVPDDNEALTPRHRIGAVSRLSAVPVSTLRIWETRYAAFEPGKTAGRHRLYGEMDVIRARLLRQLTESGHSIGTIANLPAQQLQEMLARARAAGRATAPGARAVRLVLVGAAIAARVNAPQWRDRHFGSAIDVAAVHADLEAAREQPPAPGGADVLLTRVNTLQPGVVERVLDTMAHAGARRAVVLYNFAVSTVIEEARAAGLVLRREPVPDSEVADLIRSLVFVDASSPDAGLGPGATIPPRRYTDEDLARVASAPTSIVCECPRHLSDLIGQLASFEEYSEKCLNDTEEDAALHAYLKSVAGSCRTLFESALQKVLEATAPAL